MSSNGEDSSRKFYVSQGQETDFDKLAKSYDLNVGRFMSGRNGISVEVSGKSNKLNAFAKDWVKRNRT